jgi:hypothetical protein
MPANPTGSRLPRNRPRLPRLDRVPREIASPAVDVLRWWQGKGDTPAARTRWRPARPGGWRPPCAVPAAATARGPPRPLSRARRGARPSIPSRRAVPTGSAWGATFSKASRAHSAQAASLTFQISPGRQAPRRGPSSRRAARTLRPRQKRARRSRHRPALQRRRPAAAVAAHDAPARPGRRTGPCPLSGHPLTLGEPADCIERRRHWQHASQQAR